MPQNFSKEEKNRLLSLLKKAETLRTYEYTDEMTQAIVTASRSGDKELQEQSWLTMHHSLKAYEDDFLKKLFGIYRTSQDYEDYILEMFTVIMLDLKEWDPSIGAPTTHFAPRFKKACTRFRNKQGATFTTTHYGGVYADIKKAVNALEQQGIYAPTPIDIRNYFAANNKNHSEQTIVNCLEQVKETSSFEAGREISDSSMANPIDGILIKERAKEIRECINSLEPQHRLIMEISYRVYEENESDKKKLTNKRIADEFRRLVGPVSDEWIKNIRDAAERDFRRRYSSRHFKTSSQINVNNFLQMDSLATDEDIRKALMEDIDAVMGESDAEVANIAYAGEI